eukprot:COSAG02_NODE_9866_length_2088_cov_1.517345_1_plen_279_part_00
MGCGASYEVALEPETPTEARRRTSAELAERKPSRRRSSAEREERKPSHRRSSAEHEGRKPSRRRSSAERDEGKHSRRHSSAERDERKHSRRRSSVEREEGKSSRRRSEEHKRGTAIGAATEGGGGLVGRPLQIGKPSESFVRNWKYQDPDQWRERRDADEIEQFQAYTEDKQQRGGKTLIDEELEAEKRRNLKDKHSHIPQKQLDSYMEYVRVLTPSPRLPSCHAAARIVIAVCPADYWIAHTSIYLAGYGAASSSVAPWLVAGWRVGPSASESDLRG